MRHLLRSLATVTALSLPFAAAHAAGITYTGTTTITDTTTHAVVGSNSFSFQDPPVGGIFNPFDDNYSVSGNIKDNDGISITFAFSAPGNGNSNIVGEVDGSFLGNYIQWNSSNTSFDLSNGSSIFVALDTFFGDPFVSLSSCGRNCMSGRGEADIYVTDNDPAIAPAPEPSSLALLGTGILGLAGVARRKLAI